MFYSKLVHNTLEDRQKYIALLHAGQELHLVREQDGVSDSSAIAVYDQRMEMGRHLLGYLSRDMAATVSNLLQKGKDVHVYVEEVTGGGFSLYGVTIRIEISDIPQEVQPILAAAQQGDGNAQLQLGTFYLTGNHVKEDDVEALKWFSLAAAKEIPDAYTMLGMMYQYGYAVKQNDVEACHWYEKGANANSPEGLFRLGFFYQYGRGGLPVDKEKARIYYQRSSQLGNSHGYTYLLLLEPLH